VPQFGNHPPRLFCEIARAGGSFGGDTMRISRFI